MIRVTGIRANRVKRLISATVDVVVDDANLALAVESNMHMRDCLQEQIVRLERAVSRAPRGG